MELDEIGANLRAARKSAGRSQAEVARALGMSRATISAIENGTVGEIGVRKIIALCAALGLSLSVTSRASRPTLGELRAERHAGKRRA
ncbi:MAG: helix-turn-helix domain-containing protein [Steroidobacteraceae bacterium]